MSNKICGKRSLIRVFVITALLLLMLVSNASAGQTVIDSITINPDPPVYVCTDEVRGRYYSSFTVIVHVTNPPPGGELAHTNYEYYDSTPIDENGMASFRVGLHLDCEFWHICPRTFFLSVYDADGNLVASEQKLFEAHIVPTILWSNPVDIIAGTPLSSTQLDASAVCGSADGFANWGYQSIPGDFFYTPPAGTFLSPGTHTLKVDFIPEDTAGYLPYGSPLLRPNSATQIVTINVLTHVEGIHLINGQVQSLNLIPEEANLLIVKLDTATQNLNNGNTLAATNNLNAFINQVSADINNGKISPTEGQALIDDTNNLINAINFLNPPKKSVPEFPSIALPLISVVGLLLLFGRKKND